ncbi:MAG TPA: histidine kinase [Vicinamibacterales bacterium]|nr:histidine kinase [Vicinamibacterales bacterium]
MFDVASTPRERLRDDAAPGRLVRPLRRSVPHRAAAQGIYARAAYADTPGAAQQRASDERLLAGARFLAVFVLSVATALDPGHSTAIEWFVGVYLFYAAIVFAASGTRSRWIVGHAGRLHAVDILWATIATTLTGGTSSNIFPFFAFVLAASSFREGVRGTLRDAAIVVVVATGQAVAARAGVTPAPVHLDLFVVRLAYIGIGIGVLFGVLSERQRRSRFEALAVADLVARVSRAPRLGPAVRTMLGRLLEVFAAQEALLAVEEAETRALSLWHASWRPGADAAVSHTPLLRHDASAWMPEPSLAVSACELRRAHRDKGPALVSTALDARGAAIKAAFPVPPAVGSCPWRRLVTVAIAAPGVWAGQLYLLDPERWPGGEWRLRFLQTIVRQVGPGLETLYLLRRLRSRAESLERARISRELHDGVLQSLAGLEMRVDVLRRSAERLAPAVAPDLGELRDLLHGEAIELRELMQRLRTANVDARGLPGELADLVGRFGRTADIDARLDWTVDRLSLTPRQCSELMRIVQEALFNVRRHSGATRVVVRVEADVCAWALIVEDNGRGLGFNGRLRHEQMETPGTGPRVIRERVAALGGMLDVESSSSGTRLEMTFPRQTAESK